MLPAPPPLPPTSPPPCFPHAALPPRSPPSSVDFVSICGKPEQREHTGAAASRSWASTRRLASPSTGADTAAVTGRAERSRRGRRAAFRIGSRHPRPCPSRRDQGRASCPASDTPRPPLCCFRPTLRPSGSKDLDLHRPASSDSMATEIRRICITQGNSVTRKGTREFQIW